MKKIIIIVCVFSFTHICSQESGNAKKLLDEVSEQMNGYENMTIDFSTSLVNEAAGILEDDETSLIGKIILRKDQYNLNYMDNTFIFDGNTLFIINHEDREISVSKEDLSEEDGFIYPSKLASFYKEGYAFKLGKKATIKGNIIQYVLLTPVDSNSDIIKVELGINTKTKHIYTLAQTGSNGSKTTFTIQQFKSNQLVTEALFSVDLEKYKQQDYIVD